MAADGERGSDMTKRECKRLEPGDRFRRPLCEYFHVEYRVLTVGKTGFTAVNDFDSEMRFNFKRWWLSGSSAFMRRAKRI